MLRPPRIITATGTVIATLGCVAALTAPALASSPTIAVSCASSTTDLAKGQPADGSVECEATDESSIDSYTSLTTPDHAAGFTFDTSTGAFHYTPVAGFSGTDSFTFTATSGSVSSDPATVTFAVTNAPVTCVATPTKTVVHDHQLMVTPDCTDPDDDPITLQRGNNAPAHGTLTITDGTLHYRPALRFVGEDTFSYRATDGTAPTGDKTVTVHVTNATPACTPVTSRVLHDRSLTLPIECSDPDGDPLTMTLGNGARPQHGTVSQSDDTWSVVYTPVAGFTGSDTFEVSATDGISSAEPALVTVSVRNHLPTLDLPDQLTLRQARTFAIRTADQDDDPVTVSVVRAPRHGDLELQDGTGTYTPDLGYAGVDSFSLRGSDGVAVTATQTVAVTVRAARPEVTRVGIHARSAAVVIDCQRTRRTCAGSVSVLVDLGRHTIAGTASFSARPGHDTQAWVSFDKRERRWLAASDAADLSVDVVLSTRDSDGDRATVRSTLSGRHYR